MNTDLVAQESLDRLAKGGAEALSDTERTVAAVWLFEAGVANGGFADYYSGSRGDLASDAPDALRAIGAVRFAQIATEANAVFGPDGPPLDREARLHRVRALADDDRLKFEELERQFYNNSEDIDALLEVFLSRKSSIH